MISVEISGGSMLLALALFVSWFVVCLVGIKMISWLWTGRRTPSLFARLLACHMTAAQPKRWGLK